MSTKRSSLMLIVLGVAAMAAGAPAAQKDDGGWSVDALSKALSAPSRPQADRDRDADRKPAQLIEFFGVERGMTVVDLIATGGYMTEVLSIAVGREGKVYAQNPPVLLRMREGAYDKALTQRLANNRLPNVVRVDSELSTAGIAPGSIDVAVTAMNYHDIHNRDAAAGQVFLKNVYAMLKPGGVLGLTDHVGNDGADNASLHRVPEHFVIDAAKAAGFVVEAKSDLLAHPEDDHTKVVFDPGLRGKTDQFVLRLRKPK